MTAAKDFDGLDINMDIAIVGMSCLFPGATNLNEYWNNIVSKSDCITDIPETHWRPEDYYSSDKKKPDSTYSKRGGFLPRIHFDPMEFGIAPKDLDVTDSAQLLGMLVAKEALIDAGYDHKIHDHSRTSCILGVTSTTEMATPLNARLSYPIIEKILKNHQVPQESIQSILEQYSDSFCPWQENSFPGMLGNVVAGRIASHLNLGGTNCVIDAACASASGAVKMAADSLVTGSCDLAISGGVDAMNNVFMYLCFSKTPAFSYTQISRPFDHKSDGILIGEGIGLMVMKRMNDAVRDGDRIYAVMKSIGSASDGKLSNSIYQPAAKGQAKALKRAYAAGGITPGEIELIEAHGTGTPVGDFTEFQGLRNVYDEHASQVIKKQWCALGSVKSQVGHTKSSAGAAGMIKAILSLYHKVLPPTLNVEKPIEKMDIQNSPFYLNTESQPWWRKNFQTPRRAGVSAFGFGGTNFHAVFEESSPAATEALARPVPNDLFIFTGKDNTELLRKIKETLEIADGSKYQAPAFYDLARWNRHENPGKQPAVVSLLAVDLSDLKAKCEKVKEHFKSAANTVIERDDIYYYPTDNRKAASSSKIAFLFPGQGAQSTNMLSEALLRFPSLLGFLDEFDRILTKNDCDPISRYLYPLPVFTDDEKREQERELTRTDRAQLSLGFAGGAMHRLLTDLGLEADCFGGHSYGEIAALYAAGSLTIEDFIQLTRIRGDVMYGCSKEGKGTMAAVKAPLDTIRECLKKWESTITLANLNAPDQGVISGDKAEIETLLPKFKKEKIIARALPVSAAFHSPLMNQAAGSFSDFLKSLEFKKPEKPVYANVTAEPYPGGENSSDKAAELIDKQLLNTVRFVEEIENMYRDGVRIFIECGSGNILSNLVKTILKGKNDIQVIITDNSRAQKKNPAKWALQPLYQAVARLTAMGKMNLNPAPLGSKPPLRDKKKMSPVSVQLNGANYMKDETRNAPNRKGRVPLRNEVEVVVKEVIKEIPIKNQSNLQPNPDYNRDSKVNSETTTTITGTTPVPISTPGSVNTSAAGQNKQNLTRPPLGQSPGRPRKYLPSVRPADRYLLRKQQRQERITMNQNPNGNRTHLDEFNDYRHRLVEVHEQFLHLQIEANRVYERMLGGQPAPHYNNLSDRQYQPTAPAAPVYAPPQSAIPQQMPQTPMPAPQIPAPIAAPVAPAAPIFTPAAPTTVAATVQTPEKVHVPLVKSTHVSSFQTPEPQTQSASPAKAAPIAPTDADTENRSEKSEIKESLFAIVAEKTGFPIDMLNDEMDLENDLAIDSIRRVEILGAIQEKYPESPAIDSSQLGVLNTLGEIVNYLIPEGGATQAPVATVAPSTATTTSSGSNSSATDNAGDIKKALYTIVAEKTGFPEDMLNDEMDLENDLAIDSIRRVEILGAVQEKFPEAPVIDSSHLGSLSTLGQIIGHLNAGDTVAQTALPASDSTNSGSILQEITTGLLNIISEKTGFPRDMLKLDMDLENDLAIDSIRRVEILGAMQEMFPKAPTVDSSQLGVLNTIEQIAEYMGSMTGMSEKKSLLITAQ